MSSLLPAGESSLESGFSVLAVPTVGIDNLLAKSRL